MANLVRELRTTAGLTQSQLAELSGVAQPNIAAYEAGTRTASPRMLERLRSAARPLPRQSLAEHRDELLDLAERFGFTHLRVFGSTARGEDKPGSDLDLLVTRPPGVGLLTVASFAEAAKELLGVEVDVVTDGGLPPGHEILATAVAA